MARTAGEATLELVIELTRLTKRYVATIVVNAVTLTCRHGKLTGFLGPNGAGKSTTPRMLTGLTHQRDGARGRTPFTSLPRSRPDRRGHVGRRRPARRAYRTGVATNCRVTAPRMVLAQAVSTAGIASPTRYPRKLMNIVRRPLATLKDNLVPYIFLNAASFGFFFGGLVVGSIWPDASRQAGTILGSLAGMSPAADSTFAAVDDGQVWLLAVTILGANILFGGLLMAILPSLVVPFAGLVIHVVFAGFLGLTFAPSDGWHILLLHLPTMVIELAAYVFFMLGIYRLGVNTLFPRSRGFDSRSASYLQGIIDLGWLCVPAILLLVLGAVYEAFEVIVLLR